MTKISDFELNIALKVGANRCLEADIVEFLNLDTDNAEVSPNIEKRVTRKLNFDEWKEVRAVSAKVLKVAMLVLVCSLSIFFTLSMTITPVRAAFFGAITTWYDEYIEVRYDKTIEEEKADQTDPMEFEIKKPKYVPEGWQIDQEYSSNSMYGCVLINSSSGLVSFSQQKDFEAGIDIDNDVVDREITTLKNDTIEANVFIYENNSYILIWKDQSLFSIYSEGLELEEVIKIAESIY